MSETKSIPLPHDKRVLMIMSPCCSRGFLIIDTENHNNTDPKQYDKTGHCSNPQCGQMWGVKLFSGADGPNYWVDSCYWDKIT